MILDRVGWHRWLKYEQVTCVKSSQGFNWNQGTTWDLRIVRELADEKLELFLPSYIDYDHQDLERRPDPVQDIVLTDEEAAAIFPQ